MATVPSMVTPVEVVNNNANRTNLEKIESFFNEAAYKDIIESSANYNTRLCIERRMRLPFIDAQTGIAQNHSSLFMNRRQRLPGLFPGQIYSYPRQRWRKKRRQYLNMNARAFARAADHLMDGEVDMHSISQIENPALQDTDSKDSQLLKDEVSKEWFYDEADMLEMDAYDEPDADSDLDYEETYSKRKRGRKGAGRGRSGTDSPSTPGRKKGAGGGGRGRKKAGHSFDPTPGDPDKPFSCERPQSRGRGRPPPTAAPPPGVAPPPPPMVAPPPCQAPPTLPPNLPPQQLVAPPSEDAPMPVLVPENSLEAAGPPPPPELAGPSEGPKKPSPSPYCDFCLGDERVNKKTGIQEELVSCSDCGRSGHPTCLQFTDNMKISVKKYRWQCIECKCCSMCGNSDNDDQLLFCDDCDRGYHMYCLNPPLVNPPEGSWSCKLCINEFHK